MKSEAVSQLCPACGLCCNGVLFGDVELQPADDAAQLAALGLPIIRKRRKTIANQPCACFDGKFCKIYENRPARCRSFECRLLRRVDAEKIDPAAALKSIQQARRCVGDVLKLVRELGNADETVPLNLRYAAVVAAPIDMSADDGIAERRSELMLAVERLTRILERDFIG